MLVIMNREATEEQLRNVIDAIEEMGLKAHPIPGSMRTAIGITGNKGPLEPALFESLDGVVQAIPVSKPFKLVSRETKTENTVIDLGNTAIGGKELTIIAGPCAVESREQIFLSAEKAKAAGATILRGGAFKPRTSPYAFQGLGEEGLRFLSEAGKAMGLPVVSEVIDAESLDIAAKYVDIMQIGARNMQNFVLLKRVGKVKQAVMLKRGMSATLEEFLMSAEYILSEGNYRVFLCERGVRTFTDFTRNTLDISIIPAVKRLSHLPIITDPSHGTGRREKVLPMARASIAAGADGVMVEMHPEPEKALSDGFQSLYPRQLVTLCEELRRIAPIVGRA
ncbi:3-deoxy-7-phosphoheptulonate synthase [bacterium]|nr:3-deoxy-7-phosphoheptulonate synthase [bacterium]MBU1936917.1 3-deoxy-7-phosphoheptulonate synthase [bacterium]